MTKKEEALKDDLLCRYFSGAKTLCLDREETAIVIKLLEQKEIIQKGCEIAENFLNNYKPKNHETA